MNMRLIWLCSVYLIFSVVFIPFLFLCDWIWIVFSWPVCKIMKPVSYCTLKAIWEGLNSIYLKFIFQFQNVHLVPFFIDYVENYIFLYILLISTSISDACLLNLISELFVSLPNFLVFFWLSVSHIILHLLMSLHIFILCPQTRLTLRVKEQLFSFR